MEIKRETTPYQLCKGFPKEFEEYVEYTRHLEYEKDPDYKFLKNLFNSILKEEKNLENIYDWDIENKTLNTITTNNTSQKAFFVKDKEKIRKKLNIFDYNNNFEDIDIDNEINEFEEKVNEPKYYKKDKGKFSMKEINENKGIYNSQIIKRSNLRKIIINTEQNLNKHKFIKERRKKMDESKSENDEIDLEYKDIFDNIEEEGIEDNKKNPNISGFIHNKRELEKNNNVSKIEEENENHCIIF